MIELLILNESKATYQKDGQAIFVERIVSDDDILIQSSCVFLAGISTSKKITAQYNLTSIDTVEAASIQVSGKFICLNNVSADIVDVNGQIIVTGIVNCKVLFAGSIAQIKELFCLKLDSKSSVFIESSMDVQDEALVAESIICMDGIQVDGSVSAEVLIANNYAEIGPSKILKTIIVSNYKGETVTKGLSIKKQDTDSIKNKPNEKITLNTASSLLDCKPEDIYDYNSPLAIALEDISAFIENFQDSFTDINKSKTLEEEVRLIESYSGYLPDYDLLLSRFRKAFEAFDNKEVTEEEILDVFNYIAEFILEMPNWLEGSEISNTIHEKLDIILRRLSSRAFKTNSVSTWASCLSNLQKLRNKLEPDQKRNNLINLAKINFFSGIGVKNRVVKLYLPQD